MTMMIGRHISLRSVGKKTGLYRGLFIFHQLSALQVVIAFVPRACRKLSEARNYIRHYRMRRQQQQQQQRRTTAYPNKKLTQNK